MFSCEIYKAMELLETYRSSVVKEELYLDKWMDGEYQHLVPNILAELIASSRFMEYMDNAIYNDSYPNSVRRVGEQALYDESGRYRKLWQVNNRIFNETSTAVALHLIEQRRTIGIGRGALRKGVWTEEDYYELRALRLVMDTMCLLCDKVFEPYYEYFGSCDNWRDSEDFPWVHDGMDATRVNEEIEITLANLGNEYIDLFRWEETEDLYPPLWVNTRPL